MSVPDLPDKAAFSVSEVASLCLLSRSRFNALVRRRVFPAPVKNEASKRPFYPHELAAQCLEIRRTGIGLSGIILFNRKPKKPGAKPKATTPSTPQAHQEIVEAIKSLGLTTTADVVGAAITKLFPGGIEQLDQGEVIRRLFLHLQSGRK